MSQPYIYVSFLLINFNLAWHTHFRVLWFTLLKLPCNRAATGSTWNWKQDLSPCSELRGTYTHIDIYNLNDWLPMIIIFSFSFSQDLNIYKCFWNILICENEFCFGGACRNLLGEDLGPLNSKELEQLERQLESSLKHVRSTKVINSIFMKQENN